jgi:Zn finger protein HypA/HybF involved in hydrogenase expression
MNEIRSCKICGGEIESENPTDICYSCQSIMANMNMGS